MPNIDETDDLCLSIRDMLSNIQASLHKLNQIDHKKGAEFAKKIDSALENYSSSYSKSLGHRRSSKFEGMITEVNAGNFINEIAQYLMDGNIRPLTFEINFASEMVLFTCTETIYQALMKILEHATYMTLSAGRSVVEVTGRRIEDQVQIKILGGGSGLPNKLIDDMNGLPCSGLRRDTNLHLNELSHAAKLIDSLAGKLSFVSSEPEDTDILIELPQYMPNRMRGAAEESFIAVTLPSSRSGKRRYPGI
jgi:K+-sensing histidine kinase KdpD